ncbi:guanine nucleotide-binding protein alpha-4 subunit [Mycena floridula]|nr:guanine nucleotide-binding protein alpha-4 subunit [Mycena floridula]
MKPSDDPLDEAMLPPADETEEERIIRLAREEQARNISFAIDQSIKSERQARGRRRIVRLLLLGQSESGKSTTLRQFQRLYTPTAFREERILWRQIIQLNVVRSVRTILDAISLATSSPQTSPRTSPRSHHKSLISRTRRRSNAQAELMPGPSSHQEDYDSDEPESDIETTPSPAYSSLEALKARLEPLFQVEQVLIAKLVPPNEDEATHLGNVNPASDAMLRMRVQSHNSEVFVRPGPSWKGALSRARVHYPSNQDDDPDSTTLYDRPNSAGNTGLETLDETQHVLHSLRKDMVQLWADPIVRAILKHRKIRLEELPGFFLNDLERITALRYIPSDDDVLKARLKTVGVSEYKFHMEVNASRDTGTEWRIVDVGGSRSQRPTWIPFFDDVDAIIFLAPISGFDQVLAEDRGVNRLEDSVLLWKAVCSNKLLANVDLVLFLNKCDLLDTKLKAGIRLAKYVRSYGERENDLDNVSKYLRSKFNAIHREYSPNPRKFYAFCTSVTDTATTAGIIASVRDMVIRQHLKQSKLL